MTRYLSNNYPIIDLHKKPSANSEVVTQMLYGESFSILKKNSRWLKIKIKEDGYNGFVENKKFSKFSKPTHKVNILKSKIYKFPNKRKKINEISFGSKIEVVKIKKNFLKFSKGWICKNDVKPVSYEEKNPFRKISIFKNIKYKWGGKSFKGIDCSALIQIFYKFNNLYCPRDTKDQIRYFKNKKMISKNAIIFWKGHVALCLSKSKLIHAYGPKKRVLIMDINKTIKLIKKTAKLNVIGIR